MRHEFAVALLLLLPVPLGTSADAQQPATPNSAAPGASSSTPTAYYAGPGITAPKLIPIDFSISTPKRCIEIDGVVKLSALVDRNGLPHEVRMLESDNAHLSTFAIALVASQAFKPGTYNGVPASVAIELTAGLHTCAQLAAHGHGIDENGMTLRSHPFIVIGLLPQPSTAREAANPMPANPTSGAEPANSNANGITEPTPIFQPNPLYPKTAKKKKIVGLCLIGAAVDASGVPQNVRIVRSLAPSLDENAIETIKAWRFNPALQDGNVPVPFEITIAVTFWHEEKTFLSFTTIVPRPSSAVISAAAPGSANNISAPVLLDADEFQPEHSPYGQLARITGSCVVAFIVNTDGIPQSVRVVKSLESSMDENVVAAVQGLRFKPGIKDGTTPVPVEVIMPVDFRLRQEVSIQELVRSALGTALVMLVK
jgi:TonB family protein